MLKRLYCFLHRRFTPARRRGAYSSGYWQELARLRALALCRQTQGRLLEVGCGEGFLLDEIAASQPSRQLWGVDVDAGRIGQAARRLAGRGQAQWAQASGAHLPCADNSFETVVCVNVIFNLASATEVRILLREMRRVCRPQGRVVFDFRNAANPFLRLKYACAGWYDPTLKGLPLRPYTADQVRAFARDAGLEIESMHAVGAAWQGWAPVIMVEARKSC